MGGVVVDGCGDHLQVSELNSPFIFYFSCWRGDGIPSMPRWMGSKQYLPSRTTTTKHTHARTRTHKHTHTNTHTHKPPTTQRDKLKMTSYLYIEPCVSDFWSNKVIYRYVCCGCIGILNITGMAYHGEAKSGTHKSCLLYTSPSPRDRG